MNSSQICELVKNVKPDKTFSFPLMVDALDIIG